MRALSTLSLPPGWTAPGCAQFFHFTQLGVGRESGQTFVETEARGVLLAVAGHDDGAQAELFHLCERFARRIAEGFTDQGESDEASIAADEDFVSAFFSGSELVMQSGAIVASGEDAFIADLQLGAIGKCALDAGAGEDADIAGEEQLRFF